MDLPSLLEGVFFFFVLFCFLKEKEAIDLGKLSPKRIKQQGRATCDSQSSRERLAYQKDAFITTALLEWGVCGRVGCVYS